MDIQDRISLLIKTLNMNKNSFSKKIGVTNTVIGHIVVGNSFNEGKRNKPSFDLLVKILDSFPEVNSEWLLRGKGTMFNDDKSKLINSNIDIPDTDTIIDKLYKKIDSLENALTINYNREQQYLETISNLSKH